MTQFTELGLAEPVLKAIAAEGYTKPTPIQEQAIPTLLEGRDLVGIAQTGTGKTAAFVLPLLSRMASNPGRPVSKAARILILAPTRELAAQIAESVRVYGSQMKLTTAIVVGGVKPGGQVRALARGVDVLVATPGRLLDHMETGAVNLSGTEAVVLDEADQMMDMGFLPAIRKVMKAIPTRRQTLLFSATMPKEIRSLANDFLRDPAEVTVATVSKPAEKIDQAVYMVKGTAKPRLLAEILSEDDMDRAIVFTRTKHGADKVVRYLANEGLYAEAIHGNKTQNARTKALGRFKKGAVKILVATDIASRGIDVSNITHVINYDMPLDPETYVHRIGRTARAGATGIAISFCDHDELGLYRQIERRSQIDIPVGEDHEDITFNAPPARRSHSGNGSGKPNKRRGAGRSGPRRAYDNSAPRKNPKSKNAKRAARVGAGKPKAPKAKSGYPKSKPQGAGAGKPRGQRPSSR